MEDLVLLDAGLRYMLEHAGVETIVGVEPAELPRLSDEQRELVLQEGLGVLSRLGLVQVTGQVVEIDASLRAMFQVITQPQVVVRVRRRAPRQPIYVDWYFVSGPSIVRLSVRKDEHYRLALITDSQAMLDIIERSLPAKSVPDSEYVLATLVEGDVLDVRDLVQIYGRVPAIQILRSDGLPAEEADIFFDSIHVPVWTGSVNVLTCRANQVVDTRGVILVQGAEAAWLLRPDTPGTATLRLETIQAGALRALLTQYWTEGLNQTG
jgi:hypothetical protein